MSANKPSLDSLFGGCNAEPAPNGIVTLNLSELQPYSKHPFIVKESDRLNELIESVRQQGVLTPLLVREHPTIKGKYEILAGHHRKVAAERVGLVSVPCIVKNVDDSNAALIVIDSNKQRGFADMLPSEIAKALKLEYDALKCQGKRTDLVQELESIINEQNSLEESALNADDNRVCGTSRQLGGKLKNNEGVEISGRSKQRYIRLNYLIPQLLTMEVSTRLLIFLYGSFTEAVFFSLLMKKSPDMICKITSLLSFLQLESSLSFSAFFISTLKWVVSSSCSKSSCSSSCKKEISTAGHTAILP